MEKHSPTAEFVALMADASFTVFESLRIIAEYGVLCLEIAENARNPAKRQRWERIAREALYTINVRLDRFVMDEFMFTHIEPALGELQGRLKRVDRARVPLCESRRCSSC